jgi:hypothetical protein
MADMADMDDRELHGLVMCPACGKHGLVIVRDIEYCSGRCGYTKGHDTTVELTDLPSVVAAGEVPHPFSERQHYAACNVCALSEGAPCHEDWKRLTDVWRHLVKRMYDECGTQKATEFIWRVGMGEHDVPSPWPQNPPTIYAAFVEDIPYLGLEPHEVADDVSPEVVVEMWRILRDRCMETEARLELLAKGIVDIAAACGITSGYISLTGPEVLHLASECAQFIREGI